jgi:hypothetical protein
LIKQTAWIHAQSSFFVTLRQLLESSGRKVRLPDHYFPKALFKQQD